ncbi:MAG: endonuclease/exonuclease/phosphatase family protein [Enterococcus sp.]
MNKVWKVVVGILVVILVIISSYVLYLYLSYHREPDDLTLEVNNHSTDALQLNHDYKLMTFNIGYGAYPSDYSFFMDGGKYSRAYDQETVEKNMKAIETAVASENPELAIFQEVDVDGDRSQHVNEVEYLETQFNNYSSVYAQNYDSAYLFYPFTQPIGKASSGLVTLSKGEVESSTRYSLPIETDFNKFIDLDRAFSVTHIKVDDDRQLALINTHLSAFTKDRSIQEAQMDKLFTQMEKEYKQGHYVIVGGDYNHDVIGNSPEVFETKKERETWTHPFPVNSIPDNFQLAQGDLAERKIPSVRAMDQAYDEETSYVSLVDGFLVSDNITLKTVRVKDLGFENSDHNPVVLTFELNE